MAVVFSIVILLLSIGVLVLIHICVVGRALRSLRSVEAHGGCSCGGRGLSKEDLETLPCYDFEGGEKGGGGAAADDCAICLETFQDGDRCRLLPVCRHSFHAQCVDSWLLKSSMCPICRSNVTGGSRRLSSMDAEGQIWVETSSEPALQVSSSG
ncbi:unnamed protein product [Spirodela intermedia]|uniref:RING-type domain-containing protein n=1 Tax=Spirodela intermedia TaxID=51605 RepID=A0A7I8LI50_SPIIN|nr:unnamed protein product [Spirodela intermedia]